VWDSLYSKVKAAALVAIPIDAVYFLAWLNGTTTWKVALIGAIGVDVPVLVAYCKRETKSPSPQ
jgi:hypothetical protein